MNGSDALDERDVIVVDLGFGDAGKGATVDAICAAGAPPAAVVRFNGGAQAAHTVVADGRRHTFSQFGAGTLAGVPTVLSRHVLVEPMALAAEARALDRLGVPDPLALVRVDARALLTTPVHVAVNRAREDARGDARHGSCGKGIGETVAYALDHPDAPTVGDCRRPAVLRERLRALAEHHRPLLERAGRPLPAVDDLVAVYAAFADAVRISSDAVAEVAVSGGRLVLEGAQGVLLDEWRGFHPHTTWSTVEPSHARTLLADAGRSPYVLGVTRTYATRHGAGPFPTEDPALDDALPERDNATGRYQGAFRIGHADDVLLRYAVATCDGVDGLAVTHLDASARAAAAGRPLRVATRYRDSGAVLPLGRHRDLEHQERLTRLLREARPQWAPLPVAADDVADRLSAVAGAPVVLGADGPGRDDRRATRAAGSRHVLAGAR